MIFSALLILASHRWSRDLSAAGLFTGKFIDSGKQKYLLDQKLSA